MDVNNSNKILDSISKNLSKRTLFKLLKDSESLQNVVTNYKDEARKLREAKAIIEARITLEVNDDKNIKSTAKKAAVDIKKTENPEYNAISDEYNDLKVLIEKIENLIKIIDKKYRLIEPAFHSNGVLTYEELEREFNR